MRSHEYRRLHAACLTMAGQSKSPDVEARWLALVEKCEAVILDVTPVRAAGNLRPQLPAAQQDKTAGRTELPHWDQPAE